MVLAIAESERVRGSTSPNPPVGCVILDEHGKAVGFGGTQPPGGPHAEVMALKEAGTKAQGGTAVVTAVLCALFTLLTGGSGVTILALGGVLLPTLLADGYRPKTTIFAVFFSTGQIGEFVPTANATRCSPSTA